MLNRALRAPWWIQAGLAVAAAVVAFALTLALQLHQRPFLLPLIAVLIVALRGGIPSGAIAATVTLGLVNYYIIPPARGMKIPSLTDSYELGVFALTAMIISILAARGRRARLTLEATVASIGDGVIVSDQHGRVRFLNNVAEQLTGWTAPAADGEPVGTVFKVIREDTREPILNPVQRALAEGIIVGLSSHALLVCRDGSELPVADSGAPIRDEQGRTIGAVLVFRDASPQRRAEESLKRQAAERLHLLDRERAARAEAERANRLKDDFLATLSHELRTPLNAVMGWSHMLQRRQLPEQQQKQALAAIHRNAVAQARLVEDVLDLSRIVTGRMALTAEGVDVSEIVRTTAESFTPAVLGKRQSMELDLAPGAEITGDPHRLRQIIWNLLSNATKFTPDGGAITVRTAIVDARIQLSVIDTGQGIDPSFLPYVFDRFRQADGSTTRGHGGLGLGLSLVRHLVEAHGGTVTASSGGAGQGSAFHIWFPAMSPDTDRSSRAGGPAQAFEGKTILVLEDDDDAREMMGMMLESMGAAVEVCASAPDALEAVMRRDFDAIVADLAMPGHDGFAFMREVRDRAVRTPALAVTAYSDHEHRSEAQAAGFGGFVTKPASPESLLAELRSLMQPAPVSYNFASSRQTSKWPAS